MLKQIPTEKHLSRMYYELSMFGGVCVGERCAWPYKFRNIDELFCLAADMSRYDPRLFSALVRFLSENWGKLNPTAIRSFYPVMSTPQTIAVMAEFLLNSSYPNNEARYFLKYLQQGISKLPTQFYFHNLYLPGGNLMQRAIDSPLSEYKKWGFIAREAPILDDETRRPIGSHDAATRKNILLGLLSGGKSIKLANYLDAMNGSISRQQALIDIRAVPGVRRLGHGRGASWKRAA